MAKLLDEEKYNDDPQKDRRLDCGIPLTNMW